MKRKTSGNSKNSKCNKPTELGAFDPDALLSESQAATLMGFTPRALQAWRHRGGGPLYVKVSARAVRYRRKDIKTWAESRLIGSTSEHPGQ